MRTSVLLVLAGVAAVQEDPPLSVEAILVKPEELPKNLKLVEGNHCVSPEVAGHFAEPVRPGFPSMPKRKERQSFAAEGRKPGTVFVFEYEDEKSAALSCEMLEMLSRDSGRSEQHPEEFFSRGRVMWVLSFRYPRADPAAEWYKERLRKRFHVNAPRDRPDVVALEKKLQEALDANDAANGLKLLRERAQGLDDWAAGQCLLGQFAAIAKDDALAEKSFRRAVELHDGFDDLLDAEQLYEALDGLGVALGAQGKLEESAAMLQRAGRAAGSTEDPIAKLPRIRYHLAASHARMRKYGEALKLLQLAITGSPSYRDMARNDPAFAEARKQKEFQELLK
jgi:tetratricopeptide (TPR) repeat protein